MKWNQELKDKVVSRLNEKGLRECPMCHSNQFTIVDGFQQLMVNKELTSAFVVGGPIIPVVAIVCNNCGFLSQHAVGALKLGEAKDDE